MAFSADIKKCIAFDLLQHSKLRWAKATCKTSPKIELACSCNFNILFSCFPLRMYRQWNYLKYINKINVLNCKATIKHIYYTNYYGTSHYFGLGFYSNRGLKRAQIWKTFKWVQGKFQFQTLKRTPEILKEKINNKSYYLCFSFEIFIHRHIHPEFSLKN